MEWQTVKKVGKSFVQDGREFYDLAIGPGRRRTVVCGVNVLSPRYGFCWFWIPTEGKNATTREDAAKALVQQAPYILIDFRTRLLAMGKLDNNGNEIGFEPSNLILEGKSNEVMTAAA